MEWHHQLIMNTVYNPEESKLYQLNGLDIDQFDVGTDMHFTTNSNSVKLEFGTTSDKYRNFFTFTIKMKDPTINLGYYCKRCK